MGLLRKGWLQLKPRTDFYLARLGYFHYSGFDLARITIHAHVQPYRHLSAPVPLLFYYLYSTNKKGRQNNLYFELLRLSRTPVSSLHMDNHNFRCNTNNNNHTDA